MVGCWWGCGCRLQGLINLVCGCHVINSAVVCVWWVGGGGVGVCVIVVVNQFGLLVVMLYMVHSLCGLVVGVWLCVWLLRSMNLVGW